MSVNDSRTVDSGWKLVKNASVIIMASRQRSQTCYIVTQSMNQIKGSEVGGRGNSNKPSYQAHTSCLKSDPKYGHSFDL